MNNKIVFIFFVILFLNAYSNAIEIENSGIILIDQEKVIIQSVVTFRVIEGEYFLLPDRKAGDIKIFNQKGELMRVFGRKGPGPNEFISPMYCDYQDPYFIVMDWGKRKLMLFEKEKDLNFSKISEHLILALAYDLRFINRKKVLISGNKADPDGTYYDLYFFNLENGKADFILLSHDKFGFSSQKEFLNEHLNKDAPLGIYGYCDYIGEDIYFVWRGNLRILKIDSKSKKFFSFGKKTDNYIQAQVTPRMLKLYKEKSKEQITENRKMSFVTGIFADDGFVGLTYTNYRKEVDGWQTIVQFYTPMGKFLMEKILPGAIDTSIWPVSSFCYHKQTKTLYFLSRTMDEEFNDIFKILKFKITF
ncbi:MAG: 6-bladed beta-propeller [Candidatus Aminicenantes bacterium]